MLVLASGDSLRGSASVAAVVDYSFHGLAGSTLSLLAEGQLPSADGELYPAAAVVVVKSIVLVNTHTSAVTINLTILKAASTARRLLPKNLSLPAGYMAIFDGSRFSVYDASGNLLTLIGNVSGLSGLLADDQHVLDAEVLAVAAALVHASRHQDTGADEISVTGLSGLLADDQHVLDAEVLTVAAALVHASRHQDTGADEISVTGLSGLLADDQHVLDAEVINAVYPVGSIYTSVVATNPGTLFGVGTWAAFGTGRVLVGIDAAQTEFDVVEETGGAKTHALSIAELAAHGHTITSSVGSGTGVAFEGTTQARAIYTESAGSGTAHNNLQPYIVVYMWKRTA